MSKEKTLINVIDFAMEGVELSVNETFESRVDDVNATVVEAPDRGVIRNIIAGNRESFNIQAVDFIYREKTIYSTGCAEAAMADNAWIKGTDDRTHFIGFAKQYPIRVEESELYRLGTFKVQPSGILYVNDKAGVTSRIMEGVSDEVVVMNFQSAEAKKLDMSNSGKEKKTLLSKVLELETVMKVEVNGVCRWYAKGIFGNENLWYDLRFCCSKGVVNKGVRLGKLVGMKNAKVSVYTAFAASASMQRNFSLYLVKADREEVLLAKKAAEAAAKAKAEQEEINRLLEEGLKASYDNAMGKAVAIVNCLSGGVYNRYLTSMEGKEVSLEDRNRIASRFTLPFTNSKRFGEVEKIAIANFKVKEADGHGIFNAKFLLRVFRDMFPNAQVAKDLFVGYWMQARLEASVKGGHTPVPSELMEFAILNIAKIRKAEIIYLEDKDLTKAFYKYADGNGSTVMKKKYDGKILVYGTKNLEEVEFFGDLNVFKTFPELGHKMPLALMATAAPESKEVHTSNQVIAKLLRVPEALPALKKVMEDAIDKKWEMKAKDISYFSDLGNIEHGVDALLKLNPEFVLSDPNLTKQIVENCAKSSINMVSGLNIPVEGFSAYMIPDYAMVYFGIKVIKDDEMFVADMKYVGRRAQLVRHPSSSAGEHVGLTAIGINTIAARLFAYVKAGAISLRLYMLLKNLYASLTGNVVVLPVNDILVNKLGGADWDGDIVSVILNETIVALLDMVPEEAIDYGSISSSGETVVVNNRMIVDAYNSYVKNGNRPVGMVVNFILAMMGTLAAIEGGKFKRQDIEALIQNIKSSEYHKAYGEGGILDKVVELNPEAVLCFDNNGVYVRQFVGNDIVIDAARRKAFADYVYSVGLNTPENFKMFLEDAIKAYSGIANDTIDAAKKGGKVDCWFFELGNYIKGGLIQPVTVGYNEDDVLVVDTPTLGYVEGVYVSEDLGAELKIFGAEVVRNKIEETLSKAEILQQNHNNYFEEDDVYGDVDFFKADKDALKYLAYVNTILSNGAPESYKDLKGYVLAFARYLAKAAANSIEERYDLFKEASLMKDGTYSGFYTKFGPEMLAVGMEDRDYILRSRLHSLVGNIVVEDGDTIDLVNGKAVSGVFTEDNLNGSFEVEVIDGVAYVTKTAKKYLEAFMDDDKFVVKLDTFNYLKGRIDISGKSGVYAAIAAANNLLKEQIDLLQEKMSSGRYSFKFRSGISNLLSLFWEENKIGTKFDIPVDIGAKFKANALAEALAGKEVELDNIVQFNYYKKGMVRGKCVPEFVVVITGHIK